MASLFLSLLAEIKSIDEEGLDVILSMLVVGLVFLGVIGLGQFSRWLSHKKRH